ncbi:MAG: hypothetical protein JKY51_02255 [Opitutaceae bacterium]|nr:hypothetical protein [Opitutaceae bacterium]
MKTSSKSHPVTVVHVLAFVCVLFLDMSFPISAYTEERQSGDGTDKAHHSYIPIVFYKNGFYPIVSVKNKKPVINVDGQLVSVKKDTKVFFSASDSNVSPTIKTGRLRQDVKPDLSSMRRLEGFTKTIVPVSSPETETITQYDDKWSMWEEVVPISGPLENAYGVFIMYSDQGVADLHWRNLRDTPEGKKLSVKIPYPIRKTLRKHKKQRYLLLVFKDGEELVPVDHSQRENLLKWIEVLSMAQITGLYTKVTPEDEVNPSLFFGLKFNLDKSDYKLLEGKVIPVNVTIDKMGMISDVTIDVNISDSISDEILDTVRLWKFFPAKRDGKLAEQEVIITLQF